MLQQESVLESGALIQQRPIIAQAPVNPSFVGSLPLTVSAICFLQKTGLFPIIQMQSELESLKSINLAKPNSSTERVAVIKELWSRGRSTCGEKVATRPPQAAKCDGDDDDEVDLPID